MAVVPASAQEFALERLHAAPCHHEGSRWQPTAAPSAASWPTRKRMPYAGGRCGSRKPRAHRLDAQRRQSVGGCRLPGHRSGLAPRLRRAHPHTSDYTRADAARDALYQMDPERVRATCRLCSPPSSTYRPPTRPSPWWASAEAAPRRDSVSRSGPRDGNSIDRRCARPSPALTSSCPARRSSPPLHNGLLPPC